MKRTRRDQLRDLRIARHKGLMRRIADGTATEIHRAVEAQVVDLIFEDAIAGHELSLAYLEEIGALETEIESGS